MTKYQRQCEKTTRSKLNPNIKSKSGVMMKKIR